MIELKREELLSISGGASLTSAAWLNAAARAITTLVDLGRSLGTAIRRSISGKVCKI